MQLTHKATSMKPIEISTAIVKNYHETHLTSQTSQFWQYGYIYIRVLNLIANMQLSGHAI
jgi:hypothetical protein